MSYEVVARRWRPLTFDSVVGQRHVTATLANAIERDRVAHAFLFTGIRGVGKTTVARLLARALNCSDRKGSEPCNECASCKQVLAGSSVDVLEIDGASNRGIDEVRSLIDAASYLPAASPFRIYIIDEVHQLTKEAFNALLKILEEPPEHVKFVLATTEAHKILPTVLSRCQRYDFRRLGLEEITAQLDRIVAQDDLEVSSDALALIAREADGSMRDAQSLLEQVAAATGGEAEAGEVAQLLGVAGAELVIGCVEAILAGDGARIVQICLDLRNNGSELEKFLFEVMELFRHVTVASTAGPEALGASMGQTMREVAVNLKDQRHQLDLQRIFGSLLTTADQVRRSGTPDLVLEMGLLKAAALESVMSATEILERLEAGGAGASVPRGQSASRGSAPQRGRASSPAPARSSAPLPERAAPAARSESRPAPSSALAASASTGEASGGPATSSHADEPPMPPPPGVAEPAPDEPGGKWGLFLDVVRSEGGLDLYVTLSNCEVTALDEEKLLIRPMAGGFRAKLEEAKIIGRLRELAAKHLGEKVVVRIVDGEQPAASGAVSAHSIEDDRQARMEAEALKDPVVKAALDVMDGKVSKISRVDD